MSQKLRVCYGIEVQDSELTDFVQPIKGKEENAAYSSLT